MKVAIHTGQLLQPVPGGIGRYVTHLFAALPAAGIDPVAFAAGPSVRGVEPWVDLGWPRGPARYELWHRTRRPAVRIDADVVHAPSLAVPPAGRRPLVVTVQDLVFLRTPDALTRRGVSFHRRGLQLAMAEAAAVVVPTEFGRNDLAAEGFPAHRIHVAPYGVVPTSPSQRPRPTPAPYLLFVGTTEPRKGIHDLLEAHARLRHLHPDLSVVIVGPSGWGAPPDTDRAGVVVAGYLDEESLDAAYRGASALVLPSRYEGFGFPIVEAMARGCPVVSSDSSCLPEVGGGATVVVPTGDVTALTDALDGLLRDDAARAALGAAGLARAATFTWERCAELHARAYRAAQEGS